MTHKTSEKFWKLYALLPAEIRAAADRSFLLLKSDPRHPSLHFKKLKNNPYWSARISDNYRALCVRSDDACIWFWLGTHSEYDSLLKQRPKRR